MVFPCLVSAEKCPWRGETSVVGERDCTHGWWSVQVLFPSGGSSGSLEHRAISICTLTILPRWLGMFIT